ncbi:uncharacterized protein LOC110271286 isoform X2 [Arachis ipaensis]|uniref:uncharacterized protein LOC110271286 isoform X2 n=1 Tax=Arachis ipaensis TaxID=130454 RepID=UPI000A2B832C|nr:uncharacterized protein LOC110271286 isoform X2 [Arachis ipaensis]
MSSVYLDSSKRSVKQTKVSRSSSSTEAKYRAVAAAQAKIMSIQKLVRELKIPQPVAPTIYCNNQEKSILPVLFSFSLLVGCFPKLFSLRAPLLHAILSWPVSRFVPPSLPCLTSSKANKSGNNWLPLPWAIVALLILGFNEFMTLLS